jgi:Uma2 family endonuclease
MVLETRRMTVAEYLDFDEASEIRNEFIDGEIIAMAGGTGNHGALIAYTIVALANALGDRDCVVRASTMRVRIDAAKYVYPDVSVVCGQSIYEDKNETVLLNPTFVVEVTSPSSLAHDHVDKVAWYGSVSSIQGYLVLDQQRVFAESYTRAEDGWRLRQYFDRAAGIALEALGCSLSLESVYRGIALDA